eukprot:CAMPEP_0183521440 /NCGR_PEP_ID=MMETSP0371-20130417/17682_1 /TAXON_ID=268820 /ORGANISM="Peridinium aciculiferum, Strain PAER-2" /LENGTH=181 /DNA_ID=CAMNT_0025719999 /DNA_START=69 /DNA_END=611 /DNA_ORIENTATION=-
MGLLDRERLLRIEQLADEVLRTEEDLVDLDRQLNGRREALGALRRGEAKGGTQWIASQGQFMRLPTRSVKEWLNRRQDEVQAERGEARSRLKSQTRDLLKEHPQVTTLNPRVCELMLKERKDVTGSQGKDGAASAAAKAAAAASAIAASEGTVREKVEWEEKRKKDTLDYSRFDQIADSDS